MPLVSIHTSSSVADPQPILSEITKLVAAQLGKPESVMMVKLDDSATMSFGGTTDQPTTLFEIAGIELTDEKAQPLTTELCQFAETHLSTPQNRVFVKLANVPRGMWGGNGKVY